MSGFIFTIYAVTALWRYARWISYGLAVSAFVLQLVAAFDEVYGPLHLAASFLFFVSLGFTSIAYAVERRSSLAAIAFIIGLFSWVFYWAGIYSASVAVPETVSSAAALPWIVSSALKIYASE